MAHTKTILLVDDDILLTRLMSVVLCNAGFKTIISHDGQDALDVACRWPTAIDLIIMDVSMPHMDGVEAVCHLRDDPRTACIPILMCTGHADEDTPDHSPALGIKSVDYIIKPFRMSQLVLQVRSILERDL